MSLSPTRTVNLGILAHVDAGKTSLTERLLHSAGVIDEVGSVDDGSTQTDTLALERRRGITIRSAVVSFALDDVVVNLIDTPGHPDFIAEVERVLSVLDGAVLVISAVEGVQAQTRVLMRTLRRLRIPTLLFVNKIDRAGARHDAVLQRITAKLTPAAVAMGATSGLGTGDARFTPHDPADPAFRTALVELLADHEDALVTAYLEDESSVTGRLREALARQVRRTRAHPVYFGSAITGAGVAELSAGIRDLLPAAPGVPDGPVSGTVFTVERGPAGENIAFARLFSGTVRVRDRLAFGPVGPGGTVSGGAPPEGKVTAISVFDQGAAVRRTSVTAGRIGKLWGLGEVRVGDLIGDARPDRDARPDPHADPDRDARPDPHADPEPHADPDTDPALGPDPAPGTDPARPDRDAGPGTDPTHPGRAPRGHFSPPTLETVVVPRCAADRGALHQALTQLAEQDPLINLRRDDVRQELSVSLYGEVQKEVIRDTLDEEFGLGVTFRESTTLHVERLCGSGSAVEVMYQDPNPFLATVGLRVDPAPVGSGVTFRLEVELGSMPYAFFRAVEDTVRQTLRQGPHGWEIADCVVTMTHSGYAARQSHAHAVFDKSMSSTGADFRHLTPLVLMDAVRRAGTQVHEPMHRFRLDVPADTFAAVMSALAHVGAVPLGSTQEGDAYLLEGDVPAGRVHELERRLPALTHGEGVLECSFDHYRPVRGTPPTRPRTDHNPLHRKEYLLHVVRRV